MARIKHFLVGALLVASLSACAGKPPTEPMPADIGADPAIALSDDALTTNAISEGAPGVLVISEDLPKPDPKPRRGFLGLFRGKPEARALAPPPAEVATDGAPVTETATDADAVAEETPAQAASVVAAVAVPDGAIPTPVATPSPTPTPAAPPRKRGLLGLFSGSNGARSANVAPDQGAVTATPPGVPSFGQVVRACGIPKQRLGKEVARAPGSSPYRLFDTQPNSVAPRMQYLTGFKDGCPRQVYAAMVLFGSPLLHETRRYDPSNRRGYSQADIAYEKAKGQVCNVPQGKPCPERRQARLDKQVTLLTAYPRFGSTSEWMDVVLFKGKVTGQSVEN